jgi:hypothetical protein
MKRSAVRATLERQIMSRFRTKSFWIGVTLPVLVIGVLLFETAEATKSPTSTMFLAILSALWIGGSSCVREIVDERGLVQRDPHLSLLAYGLAKILYAALLAAGQSFILAVFLSSGDIIRIPPSSLWMIMFLTTISGATLAMLLSALCDEPATALAWFPLLLVPQVVFGGFLFQYDTTTPFSMGSSGVVTMPQELRRTAVESTALKAAGAICVSRWALETFAAVTLEQDLNNSRQFESAMQVAGFVPLTLAEERASETLLRYITAGPSNRQAPPKIAAHAARYFLMMIIFAAGQAGLLILILPFRDPRKT